jgi:hypothetical protein
MALVNVIGLGRAAGAISARGRPPGTDQARAALLQISDFPTGWATLHAAESTGKLHGLCGRKSPTEKYRPQVRVEAGFAEDPQTGPIVQERLLVFRPRDARRALAATKKDAASCTSFDDSGHKWTVEQLSFPTIGDDSLAVQLHTSNVTSDMVFARMGATAIQITTLGLQTVDPTDYVNRAIEKVRAAQLP